MQNAVISFFEKFKFHILQINTGAGSNQEYGT